MIIVMHKFRVCSRVAFINIEVERLIISGRITLETTKCHGHNYVRCRETNSAASQHKLSCRQIDC